MEKRLIGVYLLVTITIALGLVYIGVDINNSFNENLGLTALVISGNISCNIADLNEDGIVNFEDKVEFNNIFNEYSNKEGVCNKVDINGDTKINILDSNGYSEIFNENYGKRTGSCNYKELDCEKLEKENIEGELNHQITEEEVEDVIGEEIIITGKEKYYISPLLWIVIGVLILIISYVIYHKTNKKVKKKKIKKSK